MRSVVCYEIGTVLRLVFSCVHFLPCYSSTTIAQPALAAGMAFN